MSETRSPTAAAATLRRKRARRMLGWATVLPRAFVVFSLVALVLIPILVSRRTRELGEEITQVAEPARDLVSDVRTALAQEMSALRGFLITGREPFLDQYREALAREERGYEALRPLARQLGPGVIEAFAELRTLSERWHDRIADAGILRRELASEEFIERIPFEEALYRETLAAATRLEDAIGRVVDVQRDRIRETDRIALLITIVLAMLALASAFVVNRLGRRLAEFAAESERRAEEEAALRHVAGAVSAAADVGEVMRQIADAAVERTRAFGAYVEQIESHDGDVEIVAVSGRGVPAHGLRVPYPGSLTEAIIEEGEPELVTEVGTVGSSMAPYLRESCGTCSGLVIPLQSQTTPLGALVLLRAPENGAFELAESEQARTLAHLASVALHKMLLLEEAGRRRDQAERVLESKSRLIRGLSHDLKNPLGAVDGYAALLEGGVENGLTPRQHETVGRIRRAVRSMLGIIDDLLELSRAETAGLSIERRPTDLVAVARESAEDYRPAAEQADLRLELTVPDVLPPVHTDSNRVRQVLENLISNAIKYTPAGGRVQVRAGLAVDEVAPGPGRWLTVAVSDTGVGIPQDQKQHIFEEFYRIEPVPGREPGSGLGLAIGQRIARLLGGEITVESEAGRGSTFTLWLPLESKPGGEEKGPEAAPRADRAPTRGAG